MYKEALLVDGARRVGKSYIVEEFARNEYKSYILVNFAQLSKDEKEIFDNYLAEPKKLFARLQIITDKKLFDGESLIIFDEVQRYPKARETARTQWR